MVSRCKGAGRIDKKLAVPSKMTGRILSPSQGFPLSEPGELGGGDGRGARPKAVMALPPIVQMCPSLPGSDAHVTARSDKP